MSDRLLHLSIWILAGLIGELVFGALIAPLLKPLARFYDPPHGKAVLAFTWMAAVAGIWVATASASGMALATELGR